MNECDLELLEDFITEAQEHLQLSDNAMEELLNDYSAKEPIDIIFRAVHTIKGVAGFLNLTVIQKLSHITESVYDKIRAKKLELTEPIYNKLQEALDFLNSSIANLEEFSSDDNVEDFCEVTDEIQLVLNDLEKILDGEEENVGEEKKVEEIKTVVKTKIIDSEQIELFKNFNDAQLFMLSEIKIGLFEDKKKSKQLLDAFSLICVTLNSWRLMPKLVDDLEIFRDVLETLQDESTPDFSKEIMIDLAKESLVNVGKEVERYKEEEMMAEVTPIVTPEPEVMPTKTISDNDDNYQELMIELRKEFKVEAEEHFDTCESALTQLKGNAMDKNSINDFFRAIHSIKGSASYVQMNTVSNLAHHLESVFDVLRGMQTPFVDDDTLELGFETLDLAKEVMLSDTPEEFDEVSVLIIDRLKEAHTNISGDLSEEDSVQEKPTSMDPLDIFMDSAKQHLETLQGLSADFAKDKERCNILFRAAHSLKSSAAYMGFSEIETEAGLIEEVLDGIINGGDSSTASSAVQDVAMESLAKIESSLSIEKMKNSSEMGVKSKEIQKDLTKKTTEAAQNNKKKENQTMRINQYLLDEFMNLVGELIINRNGMEHLIKSIIPANEEQYNTIKNFRDLIASVSRTTDEMQSTVMQMRMIKTKNVFQKVPRMVRDITRKNGKKVDVKFVGEENDIDKVIAEIIVDPLVHIVRNSLDHGIESPADRKAKGKDETGTLILKAENEGQFMVIEAIDDGNGIDPERVLKKAIENGLTTEEQGKHLSNTEIVNFIFAPGFSTADKVTEISGRGVGMDVVFTNLNKLGGKVSVSSEFGKGTIVRLEVPLSISLTDAMLVNAGGEEFAIPVDSVKETVKVKGTDIYKMMSRKSIKLRNEVICIAGLRDLLNQKNRFKREFDKDKEYNALILETGNDKLAVIVDEIHRKEEIVVKPLPDYLAALPGISGASILGDGTAILIVDSAEMIALGKTAS